MNNLKENPVGIDRPIKRIQTALYNGLLDKWDEATSDNLEGYGRIYRNQRNDKKVPEHYLGDNEYKEVLLDDTKLCTFFFHTSDFEQINGNMVTVDCEIFFSVNLTTVYPDTRGDMEVRNDVMLILNRNSSIEVENIVTGLENVYSGFSGVASYFKDMQEYHHFKVKGKIKYNINC